MTEQPLTPQLSYAVSDVNFVAPHFPKYDFWYLMAEGSLGASYKAIQNPIDRKVCLKVIARRIGREQSFAEVFTDHAKATAQLNHPNLVQLYDFGNSETEDLLYMVSEYVSGTTLEEAANGQPVEPRQVLDIMTDILNGMIHAHKHDIVHGDLQPSTIMINRDIEAKISDFGLAMSLRMHGDVKSAPLNPHFTAPEIYFGQTHGDRLTDVYSIGAIMYFLLTAIPFDVGYPLASTLSTCDDRFDKVIAKAMNPDRMLRYESVAAFLEAIEELKHAKKEVRRMPAAAAYIAALDASQNQTVRVVQRPNYGDQTPAQAATSPRLVFPTVHLDSDSDLDPDSDSDLDLAVS